MQMQENAFPEMEKVFLQYFNQCHVSNSPVNGSVGSGGVEWVCEVEWVIY